MAYKKGKAFEKETAELAGKYGKRMTKSGAVGTMEGIDTLVGDVQWRFPWFSKNLSGECKHGYGRKSGKGKYITLNREWFEKHMTQARAFGLFPFFSMKFKFATEDGMSKFVLIPHSTMRELILEMDNMWQELQVLREEVANEQAMQRKA